MSPGDNNTDHQMSVKSFENHKEERFMTRAVNKKTKKAFLDQTFKNKIQIKTINPGYRQRYSFQFNYV